MIYSPLRYPGGKGKLTPLIKLILNKLNIVNGTYIEPFAGGAAVALELLESGSVDNVVINDYDKGIASFWKAVLSETDRFVDCIQNASLTMDEWRRQREIVFTEKKYSFELGFATFYMNRTNRSGIIKGGPIGGYEQRGEWSIASRFNKDDLCKRINRISRYKSGIRVYNKDVKRFIPLYAKRFNSNSLIYFDPPYFKKGEQLYMNFFNYLDHKKIEELIRTYVDCYWIITYDDTLEMRDLYKKYECYRFDLSYSAAERRESSEIMIFKSSRCIPSCNSIICGGKDINLRRIEAI